MSPFAVCPIGGQSLNASFVCAKAGDESSNSAAANLCIISSQKYDCAQPQQPPKGLVPKERAFYRAVLPHCGQRPLCAPKADILVKSAFGPKADITPLVMALGNCCPHFALAIARQLSPRVHRTPGFWKDVNWLTDETRKVDNSEVCRADR